MTSHTGRKSTISRRKAITTGGAAVIASALSPLELLEHGLAIDGVSETFGTRAATALAAYRKLESIRAARKASEARLPSLTPDSEERLAEHSRCLCLICEEFDAKARAWPHVALAARMPAQTVCEAELQKPFQVFLVAFNERKSGRLHRGGRPRSTAL
jgi:hypothetical protein